MDQCGLSERENTNIEMKTKSRQFSVLAWIDLTRNFYILGNQWFNIVGIEPKSHQQQKHTCTVSIMHRFIPSYQWRTPADHQRPGNKRRESKIPFDDWNRKTVAARTNEDATRVTWLADERVKEHARRRSQPRPSVYQFKKRHSRSQGMPGARRFWKRRGVRQDNRWCWWVFNGWL